VCHIVSGIVIPFNVTHTRVETTREYTAKRYGQKIPLKYKGLVSCAVMSVMWYIVHNMLLVCTCIYDIYFPFNLRMSFNV
jgi:hypothetical protein